MAVWSADLQNTTLGDEIAGLAALRTIFVHETSRLAASAPNVVLSTRRQLLERLAMTPAQRLAAFAASSRNLDDCGGAGGASMTDQPSLNADEILLRRL